MAKLTKREVLELVRDCSSQEWQQPDGKRMAATDNQGRRMWFITEDIMQEVRTSIGDTPAPQSKDTPSLPESTRLRLEEIQRLCRLALEGGYRAEAVLPRIVETAQGAAGAPDIVQALLQVLAAFDYHRRYGGESQAESMVQKLLDGLTRGGGVAACVPTLSQRETGAETGACVPTPGQSSTKGGA